MLSLLLSLFSFLLLFVNLSGEEEELTELFNINPYIKSANTINNNSNDMESAIPLANLEGEPSSFVHGCVNVITGQYCESQRDLVIHHGVDPICIDRSYLGTGRFSGSLGLGWNVNHSSFAQLNQPKSDLGHVRLFIVKEDHGGKLYFEKILNSSKDPIGIVPLHKNSLVGTTNNSMGFISGQTNLKNHNISLINNDKDAFCLKTGFGETIIYKELPHSDIKQLDSKLMPSGNKFVYDYLYLHHSQCLRSIKCMNSHNECKNELNFNPFHIKNLKQSDGSYEWKISTTDGRWVNYSFYGSDDLNLFDLYEVTRSDGPRVEYDYLSKCPYVDCNRAEKKHYHFCLLSKKILPDNRFLYFDYYDFGSNPIIEGDMNFKNPEDPRIFRVKNIYAPCGTDTFAHRLYQFIYDVNLFVDKKKKTHALNGACKVYDAYNNKTLYEYDVQHRLVHVDKFHPNGTRYTHECMLWGSPESKESGCLLARSFEVDGQGMIFAHTYEYDHAGNVLIDRLYGNLTGNQLQSIKMSGAIVIQNSSDCYLKQNTYSNDGLNLLLSETDGVKSTTYVYAPNSNRLIAKYQGSNQKIYLRSFYWHNADGAIEKEVVDDGSSKESHNLSGVTQRRIVYYTQSQNYPVGFPEMIEEKHLDLSSGKEILNHKVVNSYTSQGKISKQDHYDDQGQYRYTLLWEYDAMGNVTKEVDAIGRTIIRQYDANGNCTFEQGPRLDCSKSFTYDYMNRLIEEDVNHSDGIRRKQTHRYDLMSRRTSSIDHNNNETQYSYDSFGRVTQITLPAVLNEDQKSHRPTISKCYDAMGHATSVVDARGMEIKTTYTVRGQPIQVTYPDGSSEHNTYYTNGLLHESIAKNGTVTQYNYDPLGRLLETHILSSNRTLSSTIKSTYSGFHVLTETDPMGVVTDYKYYPNGKLKSKQKGDSLTSYVYDSLGRLIKTKEHYGQLPEEAIVKIIQYDLLNRATEERVEDTFGNIQTRVSYAYDVAGNVCETIAYQQEGKGVTKTQYDSHGTPIVVIDAEGNKTITTRRYDYHNPLGQSVSYIEVVDPLGNVNISIQDALGRPVKIVRKNAMGKITQMQEIAYDANGNCTLLIDTIISPNTADKKIRTLMEYDSLNRLTSLHEAVGTPEQKTTKIVYNLFGQKQTIIKADGIKINHDYDPLGRLSAMHSSDGTVHYHYFYDLNSNLLKVEDHFHHKLSQKIYDSNNRILKESLANFLSIEYCYDRCGKPTKVTLPDGSSINYKYKGVLLESIERADATGQSLYVHRYTGYDQTSRVTNSKLAGEAGTLEFKYDMLGRLKSTSSTHWQEKITSYDAVGNMLEKQIKDKIGEETSSFAYDDLYQLIKEKGLTNHDYIYDSHYNRVVKDGKSHIHNPLHQLLDDGIAQYSYDLNGNVKQKTKGGCTTTYIYDALDRLISIHEGHQKINYIYDDNNRRLYKFILNLDNQGKWETISSIKYLYQGQNEIGAYNGLKELSELRVLGIGKGAEIGAAIAIELNQKTYIPIHDYVGSVACLIDASTGDVVETYRYSAFGEALFEDSLIPWRFASKRYDPESGLIYFGRRYYDPESGRWVTPDPIGREGGPNLYAYVLNSPLTHFDLYGLFKMKLDLSDSFRSERGSSPFWKETRNVFKEMITYPGLAVKEIAFNLIPIPYVKDVVEFGGWCLMGENPSQFKGWNREKSRLYIHEGYGDGDPHLRHLLFNGIGVSYDEMKQKGAAFSKSCGGVTVYCLYNASHGFLLDIGEVICQKLGIPTHAQQVAERECQKIVEGMGPYKEGGELITSAHSQGAETVHNLSSNIHEMLKLKAFGPARVSSNTKYKSAQNFVSPLDLVTYVADPIGLIRGIINKEVTFVQPRGCPFANHFWDNETYASIYRNEGNKFKMEYGSVE